MSAISSRLPLRRRGGPVPSRFARVGVVNLALAALLVGAGVAAYLVVTGTQAASTAVRTATVSRGVVLSTVSATGALQAASQLDVDFTSSGQLVAVGVKAGQHVRSGQVLGRIDATTARQSLRQAQAQAATAQAQLQATLTGETPQQRAQDAVSVTQAQQSLANAKASLAAATRSVALDRQSAAASIAQAQRQLRVDQGQENVDLAKSKSDATATGFANVDAAAAAVTADKQLLGDRAGDAAVRPAGAARRADAADEGQHRNSRTIRRA